MIAVTGAAGFIGSSVCRLATTPIAALVHRPAEDTLASRVVVGDVCSAEALDRLLVSTEAVVHLASLNVDRKGEGYDRVNVGGVRALLAAMGRHGVRRVLYVSTTGVYGHGRHAGSDERTPVSPDTPLSRSKAAAEALLLSAHRRGDIELTLLRHRFVYGAGDRHVLPGIHRAASRIPFLIDRGQARFSFVWVDDIARVALRLVAEPEPEPEAPVYHVTGGAPVRYAELAAALCRALGGDVPTRSLPLWLVRGALQLRERIGGIDPETAAGVSSLRVSLVGQDQWFSDARLRHRLPDFEPTPWEDGLEASMSWYRSLGESAGPDVKSPSSQS